jgi:hypothetical protein
MHDILAHASNYTTPTQGMRYAAGMAKAFGGSLTGIFVAEPIIPPPSIGAEAAIPAIYAVAAQVVEEAIGAEPAFDRWACGAGLSHYRWQVATGFLAETLAAAANWHDVLVLESGQDAPWTSVGLLGHALVTCGIPAFVVPTTYTNAASTDSIAIASNDSLEAVRAVHAALPLLKRARRVVLLQGPRKESFSPIEWKPAFTIEDHLARHGVRFSTRVLDASDDNAGAAILDAAGEAGADILVMGAYGRSRLSEWILGGATRHVLEHAALPVFLRH